MEKEIVKYNDKWWMLEEITDNNMAVLYRNGQPTIVPSELIEYKKEREENKLD